MNIRKSRLEDIENNLFNIYNDGFNYHYSKRPDIFLKQDELEFRDKLIDLIRKFDILLLEDGKNILGYVLYEIKDTIDKTIWINELVVDKNSRRLGNGNLLMEKVKEIAK